jgi:hypothetical protein
MADSCVTRKATLAQSTKMNAMCKRGRSSEVPLDFFVKFHRKTASCCQCCGCAVAALLKECESFKEKQLFCFTISAAQENNSAIFSPAFSISEFSRVLQRVTASLADASGPAHRRY